MTEEYEVRRITFLMKKDSPKELLLVPTLKYFIKVLQKYFVCYNK